MASLMAFVEDLRFALRILFKRPWLTAMMVLVLAAGIGVNTTVFTLFNAVLIRGLPFPEGERVLFAESVNLARDGQGMAVSYPDFSDWRDGSREFEGLAAYSNTSFNLSDDAAAPARFSGTRITANAFRLLRVEPILGRNFLGEEDRPGGPEVVLISHGLWQDRYGADDDIVGQTIRLDERPRLVVGVMPPDFQFPTNAELWTPLAVDEEAQTRDSRWLGVFGRLDDQATRASAESELTLMATRLAQEYPETNEGIGVQLLSGNQQFNGGNIETMFLAMLGAVGFVLLIACANVANVQLTRAADREREISVRTALGAGRWRIIRQLLVESVALSTAGGLVGLAFSYVGVHLFDLATVEERPYFIDFRFDATVFAYLAGICLITGVLFGLAPAVHALRTNVNSSLKEGSRGQTGGTAARRFSTAMVIAEVALSVVLLVGAGLMLRSFWNLYSMDLGIQTENRLVALLALPEAKYPEPADRVAFHEALFPGLRALPGALSVTSTSHLPGQGFFRQRILIEGSQIDDPEQRPSEAMVVIGDDYLEAVGATLARGRNFTSSDDLDSPPVGLVNLRFAEKYWPGDDAIGKRLELGDDDGAEWMTIVGVTSDIRQNSASESEIRATVYRPFRQDPNRFAYIIVLARVQPTALADPLRTAVTRVDPHLPLQDVMTLEQRMERSRWAYTVFGSLFAVFAAIALTMAAVGVFALVADSVRRRAPEFGIRLALGAAPGQIQRLVLSQAIRRVAIGVALGLPLAYLASQVLGSMLVGVHTSDAVTLAGVSLFLLAMSGAASWLPARRVVRIDPATALRNE